ncbi:sigma-70 family RNA polymerase sigma factor [Flavobacterium sp. xlx-214]|uniref:RNA polymerase sigma factor n=1 Tax=unclassified Flavobacterium TaxID=196869 RepID=UPI0013D140C9|nr:MULTISPECIES: sigma-70 family RNA polymerase sigma factor [unclassified Flavobacterium]MBA5793723.1 sigma-70 family RNA polymerase sigma factor [Flavobacterium sp. xlx-221]QMI83256.1 sigma-70 family RNA polymerase sigma factor [Flavobacterium sp. xlx-214]
MNENLELEFVKELEKNQNIIHKVCRIYTNNLDEHNDLFQEISIQLWKAYKTFKGESKFSTWAYKVSLNTAISLFRKSSKNINTTSVDFAFIQFKYDEYNEEEEVKLKKMYQAIHQLNDIDKAFVFLYLEDKNYTEIAETLGLNEGNVRVKMNRIKTRLSKIVNS